ncbi:Apoptosis-inducing factor 2 [Mortierella sp. NVP85]|nr:Apoptosis-inducing factor 2 [Mortierella sp. NVP85]
MASSDPVKVVVVGGSFGGISVINQLLTSLRSSKKTVHITLVEKRDARHNNLGSLRSVADTTYAEKVWIPYTSLFPENSPHRVVKDTLVQVHHHHIVLQSGATEPFDYLVLCTGASNPAPAKFRNVSSSAEAIAFIKETHAHISNSKSIVVIGGGATGFELSGEIKNAFPDKSVTLIHSTSALVDYPGFADKFKAAALRHLRDELGITVILNERVNIEGLDRDHSVRVGATTIHTSSGQAIESDLQFFTVGNEVDTSYMSTLTPEGTETFDPSSLTDQQKHLIKVKKTLQLDNEAFPHIFAVGDCTNFVEVPTAYASETSGSVAGKNLAKLIQASPSTSVEDIQKAVVKAKLAPAPILPNYMALSTGPSTGVTIMPLFGTSFGNFFSKLLKGKDVMISRINKDMKVNAKSSRSGPAQ